MLSIVDNRTYKRLDYEVLDHAPTHQDVRKFFGRVASTLEQRGLEVKAITTDASTLYPVPIAQVFGDVAHQVCQFHVLKEITKAVLRALAAVRKQLEASKPKLGRGRPSGKKKQRIARQRQRLQAKIGDLFEHRHLFVRRSLTSAQKKTLVRITRGQQQLRSLRSIMDEVYARFDRRCRIPKALGKLRRLRQRVRRFQSLGHRLKKLFSPNLEKALTFLDDRLLPSTSNAVERSNRRHRKMQKTVYRVRTRQHVIERIALDLLREARQQQQRQTRNTLHQARAG